MSIYRGDTLIAGAGGPSRNIGEIVPSLLPLTDAGLHLLDGSLISGSGIYSAFVTYIAGLVSSYPNLFTTETNWQTSVSAYGVCGKFVYDSTNNTVRLPKVTGIIEGTVNVSALGDLVEAGLPNITGEYTKFRHSAPGTRGDATGAFRYKSISTSESDVQTTSGTATLAGFDFDASRSNSTYGNSTTVQPQTIKAYYYIVIANSIKTNIQVDIDQIASDLNLKAGKDELDGPWVESFLTIAKNATITGGSYNQYSLSSYLPNDGSDYEVWGFMRANAASASYSFDSYVQTERMSGLRTCSGYGTTAVASPFIVIVGTERWIRAGIYSTNTNLSMDFLRALGYRRIGTN